jgi:GNAT superfamily N-acetyltransferase
MKPTIQLVPPADVLPLRARLREEANTQIVHDQIHRRPGWTLIYRVQLGDTAVGFAEVAIGGPWTGKPTVFEFYLLPAARARTFELFEAFLAASGVKLVEAQTHCGQLGDLAQLYGRGVISERIVFRDGLTTALACPGASLRRLTPLDEIHAARERRQGGGGWQLDLDGTAVGKGGILFHYNPPYGDIWMDVEPAHRRRGLGAWLVQELKRECYELGAVPAARCNPENVASRQTLQKAGFVPRGNILVGALG